MSFHRQGCYAEFTHPSLKDSINQNNISTLKLSLLVAEFAQQMAAAHEQFAKEVQAVIGTFRRKNNEFQFERPVDSPSSIQKAWESLLHETEMDAQAHLDAASLLINNVYKPLEEVAIHKQSQAHKLNDFRDKFEEMLQKVENQIDNAEKDYIVAYNQYEDCHINKSMLYNAHNEYIFQLRASNRSIDQFQIAIPQVLEELEEIYIDTSNTINVAIESHALLLLTKANEQHRRFEDLLQICRQVNPQLDISYFVNALNPECAKFELKHHKFHPVDSSENEDCTCLCQNQLIIDKSTDMALVEKRALLQREAAELTSYITQNQDISHSLVNICQRNLANHLYSKVYETQEDMCRKRNEIRMANIQLAAVRAQIELLTPKQNGTVENTDQDKQYSSASIKGMWKKAFKSLKSSPSDSKLSKKASLKKKQGSKEEEEEEEQGPREIDPVYSLLKCAADLPKNSRIPCTVHAHCGGHHPDSSSSTSKTSSPSSSVSQSPKTRRKKLNARMKSFSLDAPEPSKHLLAIDETTKKKSSSFTNTCLRGSRSPDDKYALSATNLRKKFASSAKASSLDIESGGMSPSPKESPKPNRKNKQDKDKDNLYVVLYHFKGKEKDDMDLRAGSKVRVTDSSDPDWWKGKCNGRSGYFPAKYVITIQKNQKVYQVNHPMHLTDGDVDMKLHKDQIVLQIGEEDHGMIFVKAANKKQAMCPLKYLNEV
ncbi:nostrin-like [Mytilus trossulus]|uniref:nostrin-like n=1 Tax=Mytilus trossulus TaxID=6551 RepID=UPI003003BE05